MNEEADGISMGSRNLLKNRFRAGFPNAFQGPKVRPFRQQILIKKATFAAPGFSVAAVRSGPVLISGPRFQFGLGSSETALFTCIKWICYVAM